MIEKMSKTLKEVLIQNALLRPLVTGLISCRLPSPNSFPFGEKDLNKDGNFIWAP